MFDRETKVSIYYLSSYLSTYLLTPRTSTGQGRPTMSHERRVREKRRRRRLITTTGCTDRRSHYYEKTRLAKSCDVWILYATVRRVTRAVSSTDNLRKWGFVKLFEKSMSARVSPASHFTLLETRQRHVGFGSGLLRDAKASSCFFRGRVLGRRRGERETYLRDAE